VGNKKTPKDEETLKNEGLHRDGGVPIDKRNECATEVENKLDCPALSQYSYVIQMVCEGN